MPATEASGYPANYVDRGCGGTAETPLFVGIGPADQVAGRPLTPAETDLYYRELEGVEVARSKPAPDGILLAAKELGIELDLIGPRAQLGCQPLAAWCGQLGRPLAVTG